MENKLKTIKVGATTHKNLMAFKKDHNCRTDSEAIQTLLDLHIQRIEMMNRALEKRFGSFGSRIEL